MKLNYEAKILSENNYGSENNSKLKRRIGNHRLDKVALQLVNKRR